jgi:hypothetical protein
MATQEFEGLKPEEREKRFDEQLQVLNTINAIFTGNLWIEKREKRGHDELHKVLDRILACPYDDLKTTISTILDALIALSFERDAEAVGRRQGLISPPLLRHGSRSGT